MILNGLSVRRQKPTKTASGTAFLCILLFGARLLVSLPMLDTRGIFASVVALVFAFLPPFLRKKGTFLPTGIWIVYYLFLVCTLFLGEMLDFYTKIPFWDTALHLVAGFCFSAIGMGLLYSMQKNPVGLWSGSLWSFCFSVTVSVLWEFYEFGCDRLFYQDMQRDSILPRIASRMLSDGEKTAVGQFLLNGQSFSGYLDIGLTDTMFDLLSGAGGAVLFGLLFWLSRGKSGKCRRVLNWFVPRF